MKPVILVVVGAAVLALLALVVLLPRSFAVTREVTIGKPLAEVFAYTLDLQHRHEWTAWAAKSPQVPYTHTGTGTAVGSTMAWDHVDMGTGSVTLTAIEPDRRIATRLVFRKPFTMESDDTFTFEAAGNGTRIRWTNAGALSGFARVTGLFLDRMLGPDYEAGLANLKSRLESARPVTTRQLSATP